MPSDQPSLFDVGPRGSMLPRQHGCGRIEPPQRDERTIAERFADWSDENPHVFPLFRRLAVEAREKGLRLGAKAIVERMRWEMPIETSGEPWRINNTFVALLARQLVEADPSFGDYFEFRERRSE